MRCVWAESSEQVADREDKELLPLQRLLMQLAGELGTLQKTSAWGVGAEEK